MSHRIISWENFSDIKKKDMIERMAWAKMERLLWANVYRV
jgi:hypothetical protein